MSVIRHLGTAVRGVRDAVNWADAAFRGKLVTAEIFRIATGDTGTVLKISSKKDAELFQRCVVGDVAVGVTGLSRFPVQQFDAMLLAWGGQIQTTTDDGEGDLKFPVDAVYMDVKPPGLVVTDIIKDIKPGSGFSRSPVPGSRLVLLLPEGAVNAKGLGIGNVWQVERLSFRIDLPVM